LNFEKLSPHFFFFKILRFLIHLLGERVKDNQELVKLVILRDEGIGLVDAVYLIVLNDKATAVIRIGNLAG
jgi:hypothetical protein